MYGDGAGLWLHVGPTGGKSWVLRYMMDGRAREMGLGPLHTVGLAAARDLAQQARWAVRVERVDPLEARQADRIARRLEAASAVSFKAAADRYMAANKVAWRSAKHAKQWPVSLATYVYPVIGDLPVGAIDTGHVSRILEPIWSTKAETAARVRGRIEMVLDFAKAHSWRGGENPARWRGHLENILPPKNRVARAEHHAALPWREVGAFMATLAAEEGAVAMALRFAILTAARTGEVLGATWSEIDLQTATWTVPADRMKAGKEHRVPLCAGALDALRQAARLRSDEAPDAIVFPGPKPKKQLSNMSLFWLLRRMKRPDITVHGFRSAFRDWSGETGQPADVSEAALAHAIGNKVQAAYQRGDLLERRRRLMVAWGEFILDTDRAGGVLR
jgi:integrase